MRPFFITLSFFLFSHSYGQDSLSNIIANNTCSCLNNNKNQRAIVYNDVVKCVNDENEKQSDFYVKEGIRKYGDSVTESQAIGFAKEIGLQVSLKLIKACPVYRNIMDTARYSLYSYMNKDSLINEIYKMNQIDVKDRSLNFYVKRCKMFFWLSKIKDAFEDAEQILALNSTNELGLHVKAMYLELNHDYDSALKIYTDLYNNSNNPRYAIDATLVKFKLQN